MQTDGDMAKGHSEKHLIEASTVSTFGDEHQVELQLGHVCNNRCVFCVSGQLTEERLALPIHLDAILAAIDQAAATGAKRLTFLGGEPTVHKSFLPALQHAVDCGFEDIVIFTNGVKTRKAEYIQKVLAIGDFEWRFSVQGGDEAAHDAVTKRRGSFKRIVQGMEHLHALGKDITVNACINEESYRSLPRYVDIAKRYHVRQVHLDMVRPADAGNRTRAYLKSIMPRYVDMAPYFAEMLEGFQAWDPDFDINVGNYPYCALPEWAHRIHHDGELTFTISVDRGSRLTEAFNKYENKRADKHHAPQCAECVFQPRCNGIFEDYAEMYGTDEFVPVTRERLAAIDPDQHMFVLHVEPFLEGLFTEAPPVGWTLQDITALSRERRYDVRFGHADGPGVTLWVTPPEGVGRPAEAPPAFVATTRCQVSLVAEPGADAKAAGALAAWVGRTLAATEGVDVERAVDVPRVVASLTRPDRLARGRTRVMRLAQKIQRKARFGEMGMWRYADTRPLEDGVGLALGVKGPSGSRVDLTLAVQSDPAKPLVGIGYALGARTEPERARGVLTELMETLRA